MVKSHRSIKRAGNEAGKGKASGWIADDVTEEIKDDKKSPTRRVASSCSGKREDDPPLEAEPNSNSWPLKKSV